MRRFLMTSSVCLILAGAIATADDPAKPETEESTTPLPALTATEEKEETPVPATPPLQKPLEIPSPAVKPRPEPSTHMAPSLSTSVTATTPRMVNADQLLYERAAYQARQRIARIEDRKWSGKSMSRPTIGTSTYALLNPMLYGYPYPIYPPAYRPYYPW